jgi:hypothetical protein
MLTLLVSAVVVLMPFLGVVALLLLVARWQRRRDLRVAQQIAVTEAIHRELGAVVAPSMTARAWGPPSLVIPIPLERPNLVAAVLDIAHRVLGGWQGGAATPHRIVVVPRSESAAHGERRAA